MKVMLKESSYVLKGKFFLRVIMNQIITQRSQSVMKVRMLFTNSKINIMVYLLLYHTYSSENTFKKLSAKLFWCLAEFEKMADKMSGNPTFDLENSESR